MQFLIESNHEEFTVNSKKFEKWSENIRAGDFTLKDIPPAVFYCDEQDITYINQRYITCEIVIT